MSHSTITTILFLFVISTLTACGGDGFESDEKLFASDPSDDLPDPEGDGLENGDEEGAGFDAETVESGENPGNSFFFDDRPVDPIDEVDEVDAVGDDPDPVEATPTGSPDDQKIGESTSSMDEVVSYEAGPSHDGSNEIVPPSDPRADARDLYQATHFSLIPWADENLKTYSGHDALLDFRPSPLQNNVVFRKKEAAFEGDSCENYLEGWVIVEVPNTQDPLKLQDLGLFLRYCDGPASGCPAEQAHFSQVREMDIEVRYPELEGPDRVMLCPEYSPTCYVLFHKKWDFDCQKGEDVARPEAKRYLVTVVPTRSALDGNECECHHPDAALFSDDSNINPSCLGGGGVECPDENYPFCVGDGGGKRAGRCSSVVVRDYLEVETPTEFRDPVL